MLKHPTIKIEDLRRIVDGLLGHVERVHGAELELLHDYYWSLGSEVMYDMSKEIGAVNMVGSLGDDWEFLLNMKDSDIEGAGPAMMLEHAAPLLRYIADVVSSPSFQRTAMPPLN